MADPRRESTLQRDARGQPRGRPADRHPPRSGGSRVGASGYLAAAGAGGATQAQGLVARGIALRRDSRASTPRLAPAGACSYRLRILSPEGGILIAQDVSPGFQWPTSFRSPARGAGRESHPRPFGWVRSLSKSNSSVRRHQTGRSSGNTS